MDILKNLTPDQISALSPESLKIILGNNSFDDDVAKMKYYFKTLQYDDGFGAGGAKYNEKDAMIMRELLLKYSKYNFYLIFELYGDNIRNWDLHTEDEINKIIPTGIDLEKICISNKGSPRCMYNIGSKIFNNYYVESSYTMNAMQKNGARRIEDLLYFHNNLKIVHPVLIELAKHFM